jgi:hypothetical protein
MDSTVGPNGLVFSKKKIIPLISQFFPPYNTEFSCLGDDSRISVAEVKALICTEMPSARGPVKTFV